MSGVCTACKCPPCLDCGKRTAGITRRCSTCLKRRQRELERPIYAEAFERRADYAEVAVDIEELRFSRPDVWPGTSVDGQRWIVAKMPGGVPFAYADHGFITRDDAAWWNVQYRDGLAERGLTQTEAMRRVRAARGLAQAEEATGGEHPGVVVLDLSDGSMRWEPR